MNPLATIRNMVTGRKSAVPSPVNAAAVHSAYGMILNAQEVTPYQAWIFYKTVSPFAKVVDIIADAVASLIPVVEIDDEVIDGHPVIAFLNKPGFNRTRRRLIKELVVQYLVTGTAYLHVYGGEDRPPLALDVLKSKFVQNFPGPDMWPDSFTYAEGSRNSVFKRDQNPRDFSWYEARQGLSQIIPIYDMDGDTRGVGLPRLNAIRYDVELRLKGIVHNASMLDNGARMSGILSFKEGMTPDQSESVASQFREMMSGYQNAGKIMVVGGSQADFKTVTQNMKDMDFAKLIEIVEDAIASRYNVPVTLFRTNAQTNNNYETAWYTLYDQAVLPTFEIIYSGLAATFNARLGTDLKIAHDALTAPVLAKQAVDRATRLFGSTLLSRNEARSIVGYEPVLGGDIVFGPMGMVPQGEDLFNGIDDDTPEERSTRRARIASGERPGDKPAAPMKDETAKYYDQLEIALKKLGGSSLDEITRAN